MQAYRLRFVAILLMLVGFFVLSSSRLAYAQSSQAAAEWALFNQILIIGIIVGLVVFGLLFYAIIRYRERPQKTSVQ